MKKKPETKWNFHMMDAKVVFDCGDGPVVTEVQFLANSPTADFNADRLTQIQNQAAHIARQKVYDGVPEGQDKPPFTVIDVKLGGFYFLGYMTLERFYGQPTQQLPDGDVADPGEVAANN